MNLQNLQEQADLLDRLERQILQLRVFDRETDIERALHTSYEIVGNLARYRHQLRQLDARRPVPHGKAA